MSGLLRIAFFGRGELGMLVLTKLLGTEGLEVVSVITCAASPELRFDSNDFRQLALRRSIPFRETERINSQEIVEYLEALDADLGVAMLWRDIIGEQVILACGQRMINLHGGDLPRYRGNACQTWAVLNSENEIGITCHLMEPNELDCGPILKKVMVPIDENSTVGSLIDKVTSIGADLVIECINGLLNETIEPKAQDLMDSLYCYPRLPRDGEIDWNVSALQIERLVRAAGQPYPGAYSWYQDIRDYGKIRKLEIWKVRIIDNPIGDFCAVPGHVIKLDAGAGRGVIAGDGKVVVLEEVSRDTVTIEARKAFPTVRQRLGLDVNELLVSLDRKTSVIQRTKVESRKSQLAEFSSWYQAYGGATVSTFHRRVSFVIRKASLVIGLEFDSVSLNQLRNYSFTRRFFDWEKKEVDFGVQIYQSLVVPKLFGNSLNFGYWVISNPYGHIEHRLYCGVTPQTTGITENLLIEAFNKVGHKIHVSSNYNLAGDLTGVYASMSENNQQIYVAELCDLVRRVSVLQD